MIVKNNPDANLWKSQQHSHITKPFFLQGFEHARNLLVELRKTKSSDIQFSPIIQKKVTEYNDMIVEEQEHFNHQRPKSYLDIQRDSGRVKLQTEQKCDDDEMSYETMKVKTKHGNEKVDVLNNFVIKCKQKNQVQQNRHTTKSKHKQQISYQKCLQNSLQNYQKPINEIGYQLEEVNNEIETYEIVFDNLCDCYQANLSIVTINQKLTKQSLTIAQQKQMMISKIKALQKQSSELDSIQKMCNEHIAKCVQRYIEQVHMYNKCQQISIPGLPSIQQRNYGKDMEDEEEDDYEQPLNLNFKRMKELNEDKIKKKVLLEPKKLQKGVSFEQQIDVISKYYEAQLSNI